MNIEQAEKQFAIFNSNADEHLNVSEFIDFCDDFINLMERKEMPPSSIDLLTNVLALFIWSDNYLTDYSKIEFLIEKFLETMKYK
jgi:hypothetical protein